MPTNVITADAGFDINGKLDWSGSVRGSSTFWPDRPRNDYDRWFPEHKKSKKPNTHRGGNGRFNANVECSLCSLVGHNKFDCPDWETRFDYSDPRRAIHVTEREEYQANKPKSKRSRGRKRKAAAMSVANDNPPSDKPDAGAQSKGKVATTPTPETQSFAEPPAKRPKDTKQSETIPKPHLKAILAEAVEKENMLSGILLSEVIEEAASNPIQAKSHGIEKSTALVEPLVTIPTIAVATETHQLDMIKQESSTKDDELAQLRQQMQEKDIELAQYREQLKENLEANALM